jgi:hypothetical protein
MVCLSVSGSVQGFFIVCLCPYFRWKWNYQDKNRRVKIQFRFHSATYACLSTHRKWISHVICHGLLYVQWFHLRNDCSFLFWYRWNCWILFFIILNSTYGLHKKLMSTVVKRYHCIIFILDLDEEKQPEIQRNKMDKIQEDI